MKALLSVPGFLTAAALLLGEMHAISAPDAAQMVADDALPLEKVAERLKQIDDDFAKQVDTFVAVVDAEFVAKRISDTVAQLLRALAKTSRSNFDELSRNIPQKNEAASAGASSPGAASSGARSTQQKNEALLAASKELAAASRLLELRVNAVAGGLPKELRRRMNEVVLGRSKSEEFATLIQTLERIQGVIQQKSFNIGQGQISCEHLIATLNAARQLTEAESSLSATALSTAIAILREHVYRDGLFTRNEIEDRIARVLVPMSKTIENQGIAIEAMIEAHKPGHNIATASEAYREAIRQFKSAGGDQHRAIGASLSESLAQFYDYLASALTSMERGKLEEADRRLEEAARMEPQLESLRSLNRGEAIAAPEKREQMVTKLQKELLEKVTKLRETTETDINARMAAVKESAEITALREYINRHPMVAAGGGRFSDAARLLEPLEELRRAWALNSPQMIASQEQMFFMPQREAPTAFKKEFLALRDRILRSLYARSLKAPELSAAPYAEKVPEAAVEALCDDMVQRGEWRRLLDILQLRPPAVVQRADSKETDAVAAIRSFLAGKNFELAEQWADAVLAYKAVLRSAAPRAPIQAAAESIKAIAKAHPEAIIEAANREKADASASPAGKAPTESPVSPSIKPVKQ